MAEILVDVFSIRTPDLNHRDGIVCIEGTGPTNGIPRHVGKMLASTNGFVLDAVCARMAGSSLQRIKTLEVGKKRGRSSGDPDSIQIAGTVPKIKGFSPTCTFGAYTIFSRPMSTFFSCLPKVRENNCKKCGVCASHCPVYARTPSGGRVPNDGQGKMINQRHPRDIEDLLAK